MTPHEQPQKEETLNVRRHYQHDDGKFYDFPQPSKEGDVRERIEEILESCTHGYDGVDTEEATPRLLTLFQSLLKEEHDRWWYAAQYSIEKKDDLDRLERAYQALTYNST